LLIWIGFAIGTYLSSGGMTSFSQFQMQLQFGSHMPAYCHLGAGMDELGMLWTPAAPLDHVLKSPL